MPNLPNCCFTDTVVPIGVSFLQAGCGSNIIIIILNFRNLENQAADCNELMLAARNIMNRVVWPNRNRPSISYKFRNLEMYHIMAE